MWCSTWLWCILRSVYCWNLSFLPFSVVRNSKEIGKDCGAISHSSQFSTDIVLITNWLAQFCILHGCGCGQSEFVAISYFLFHVPESVGLALLNSWQKWKGNMPASLLSVQKGTSHCVFVLFFWGFFFFFGKLTSTFSFYFSYLIRVCESKNLFIHSLYCLVKSCKKTPKW